ncbi:hypothetical protein PybrP1_010385 [[Pythium] brassicae (nom. inval.)]|nr:hypothetical protein PybrP1_010385 [[Pythium] brassicae (nom. inval.)]
MVTLLCAVVGVGGLVPVEVDTSATVTELKERIKAQCPDLMRFDAFLLTLYLARRSDSSWLRVGTDEASELVQGGKRRVPPELDELMEDELSLVESFRLDRDEYLGAGFVPAEGDIHVLVELPALAKDSAYYKRRIKWLAALQAVALVLLAVFMGVVIWHDGPAMVGSLVGLIGLCLGTSVVLYAEKTVCEKELATASYAKAEQQSEPPVAA